MFTDISFGRWQREIVVNDAAGEEEQVSEEENTENDFWKIL